MDHIWTNPSFQRSIIKNRAIVSEMMNCLKLNIPINGKEKIVYVFPNKEYTIRFHNDTCGKLLLRTGMVLDVYNDQIKIKCIKNSNSEENTASGKHCILYEDPATISKYDNCEILFIPIDNIEDIGYAIEVK